MRLLLVLLLSIISNSILSQPLLGDAVHNYYSKSKSQIVSQYGSDYELTKDKSGREMLNYQRTFNQAGKEVTGIVVFHFNNDQVTQITTIIPKENYAYWDRIIKTKLVQRDEQWWIEPRYSLLWNLKIVGNALYLTGIDNRVIRAMYPEAFGRNWTKEIEAEFMKQCLYGNPENLGKEKQLLPACSCVVERLKDVCPDANMIRKLSVDDLMKLIKSCAQ